MQTIPNKIVIGEEDSPILTVTNDNIESVSEESAVALIGDELFIDQFVSVIKYNDIKTYDIRKLPYGTKITFYSDNRNSGIFYCEKVERIGKEMYRINAISAIGLMDKQWSKGGVYTGQRFDAVLREIVGAEYEYTINEDVAALQVYGWLPYAKKRKNLHQLIMAYGVNIVRNDNGGMLFTFLIDSTPQKIPSNRIYSGGKVTYNDPASRVEVVEHLYHFLESGAEETLFDNTSNNAVVNALIIFDKPVYPNSLRVLDGGNLTIADAGVNYAVVRGVGVLVGKPYIHTTKVVAIDNKDVVTEKIVRVEEATLVTLVNSENVLARLAEYYFNATVIENSIIVDTEKCGRRYEMINAFYEEVRGFISKMSTVVSSIKKAVCEIIADYTPNGHGASYTNIDILSEASGTWTVPEKVFEKAVPSIRVVLIGGGETGQAGGKGADGETASTYAGGAGGVGGVGGEGGAGGKIYSITIDCTDVKSFDFGRSGLNTFFKGGGHDLSSANGVSSDTGFLELFSGAVYALPGRAGQNGGAGGKGGYYPHNGTGNEPEAGESVSYNGTNYAGGAAGKRIQLDAEDYGLSSNMDIYVGGGGGSGAAVGTKGKRGYGKSGEINCQGGAGVKGANGDAVAAVFGSGGNGGHGGSGGGGGGIIEWYNSAYNSLISKSQEAGGAGGAGGAGSEGYQGCVIIYY